MVGVDPTEAIRSMEISPRFIRSILPLLRARIISRERGHVTMSLDHVAQSWDVFAKYDPMWAILSNPAKRGNKWDVEEFFATRVVYATSN
jgi:hypothetical protein